MIRVTPAITLDESEINYMFIRASGPGGQNVNKVSTAVQIRFDVRNSHSLPEDVRERLMRLAGKKLTEHGVLVITARRYRTQQANRKDGINRLVRLVQKAAKAPKPRRRTKPSKASKEQRLQKKRRRAQIKQRREHIHPEDE